MYKLIVTYLDKTLLNDKKELTPYTAEVLAKCRARGIITAFATARPERATMGFQRLFQPDYVISNNGATVSRRGEITGNNIIPAGICERLLSALVAMNGVTCITAEAGDRLFTNYCGIPWDNENWNPVYDDFSRPLNTEVSKISAECKDIKLISKVISEYPLLHLYANSGEDWCQIMHIGSTKMNAARLLVESLNIKTEEVIAFGDDFNDVEMLEACGLGVAVENAIEQAKQAASSICPGNNYDGVAKWLEANLLI